MNKLPDISSFVDVLTPQNVKFNIVKSFRKIRKQSKISQVKLSELSGVSLGSIKRFENTGDISLNSLLKISDSLNRLWEFDNLFTTPVIKSAYEN